MITYTERTYRKRATARDLISFRVAVKETDLWISSDQKLEKETRDLVLKYRYQLENYIQSHPSFLSTLTSYAEDPYAPEMIRDMIQATRTVGVGPMAAVAGAIAQFTGKGLLEWTDQVIVENGGDIFLQANRPVTVAVFAGSSPFSEKVGLIIQTRQMPLGICSSSATVGHSLSMGSADAVCLISASASLADGAATALGNKIKKRQDLEKGIEWAKTIEGIWGGIVIMEDRMASWGDLELVGL